MNIPRHTLATIAIGLTALSMLILLQLIFAMTGHILLFNVFAWCTIIIALAGTIGASWLLWKIKES